MTYNFNPRYQITRDVLAYLRIASGYQAGGPNIPYPTVPPVVKSDTLTNYEVGLKSEFWDRRALLNIAAFYIDWNNIQVDALQKSTGLSFLENGGTAKSEGVSLDGSLRPLAGLVLSGNVTYTDAVLTQNVPNGAGQAMMFAALLESGAGGLHAINERVADAWATRRGLPMPSWGWLLLSGAILILSVFVAVKIGLIQLIARGYVLLAVVFLLVFLAPLLTLGVWRIARPGRSQGGQLT